MFHFHAVNQSAMMEYFIPMLSIGPLSVRNVNFPEHFEEHCEGLFNYNIRLLWLFAFNWILCLIRVRRLIPVCTESITAGLELNDFRSVLVTVFFRQTMCLSCVQSHARLSPRFDVVVNSWII